jgi:glutamyl-tRNA synthetase
MNEKVRVRFAPSPTGFLHIGGLRTALYNYLLARKTGGKYVLRVEDTDRSRLVEGALENIVQTFAEFGINPDEGYVWQDNQIVERGDYGPYLQSKRLDTYQKYAQQLIDGKHAYYCFCTPDRLAELRKTQEANKVAPKYDKRCLNLSQDEIRKNLGEKKPYVIRLNVPANETIEFEDVVHGKIKISSNDVDDQVLLKSDGFPTYHLGVVIDDHLMAITHIFRGEEWIPSTPKHILLYKAFGWEIPVFIHLPLLLSKTRKKLSKREGDVAVKEFLAQGYLKEALINFVALLGWNPKTEREIFALDDLVGQFDLNKLNKSGAVFDLDKLDWINGHYIRQLSSDDLLAKLTPYLTQAGYGIETLPKEFLVKMIELEKERLKKLSEIGERVAYFFKQPEYDGGMLVWKKSSREDAKIKLSQLATHIQLMDNYKLQNFVELQNFLKAFIADNNFDNGSVLWPLRVALTGLQASPGPFEIMHAFGSLPDGKQIIIDRINAAVSKL